MADPKSDPALAGDDAPLEESDAPVSVVGARPGPSHPPLDDESDATRRAGTVVFAESSEPFALKDDPRVPPARASSVGVSQLRAHLALRSTQKRMYGVVSELVGAKTPKDVKDDLVQKACVAALTAESQPRSSATLPGWLATVTRRAVFHHYRAGKRDLEWLDRSQDVEEQAGEPVEPPEDRWLVADWLASVLADDEGDQQTYEMLRYKATTGGTDREVAEAHFISYAAWTHRLSAFKKKYLGRKRRREALFIFLFGSGAVVVALVTWWLLGAPAARPVPEPVPVTPPATAPSASGPVPPPEPFRPAGSTGPEKPPVKR